MDCCDATVRGFVIPPSVEHPLDRYLGLGHRRVYRRGVYIFTQADLPSNVYYLKAGEVRMSVLRPDGSEKTFFVVRQNCTFGEAAAFDSKPFLATAMATRDSEVYVFAKAQVEDLMCRDHELSRALITSLSCKVGHLASQVEELSFFDVKQRVATALATLCLQGSDRHSRPGAEVHVTHQELAAMIGASRVAVSRALENLSKQGLVALKNRRIVVRDPGVLSAQIV